MQGAALIDSSDRPRGPRAAWLAWLLCLLALSPGSSHAAPSDRATFPSAEAASDALFEATRSGDAALLVLFGPHGETILHSGDPARDADARARFVRKYQELHRLVAEPDGTTTLYVGVRNWPVPVPLVRDGDVWYFDTEAGSTEILLRQMGRNELSAIRVCGELVSAQHEYKARHDGVFAPAIVAGSGSHAGLYWQPMEGEPSSPIGPLLAAAGLPAETKQRGGLERAPFRGYFYRLLTAQGPAAVDGERSYLRDGKLVDGFAFVAYPASYRATGVMTFVVASDGVVFEKDLGPDTVALAQAMKRFDPGSGWVAIRRERETTSTAASDD